MRKLRADVVILLLVHGDFLFFVTSTYIHNFLNLGRRRCFLPLLRSLNSAAIKTTMTRFPSLSLLSSPRPPSLSAIFSRSDAFGAWGLRKKEHLSSFRPLMMKAAGAATVAAAAVGGRHHPRIFPSRKGAAGGVASSPYATALALLLAFSVVLLLLLALGIFSLPVDNGAPHRAAVHGHGHGHGRDRALSERDGLGQRGKQWTEIISWEPRAFLYHNFLSKEECEYLIELAKPHMLKSTVLDSSTGRSKDSRVRTSSGMFLQRGRDKIIRAIEKRIADFTFIPAEHGEGLQILHYELGQKYEPHFDYFVDEYNIKNGGQRMATLLMYLSDVEEGGETVFPNAKVNSSTLPWYNELSECGKKGLALKPKMGNALLFWSMKPDATLDPLSLHGACPVIKGHKWAAPKWMHVHEYKM